MYLLYYLYIYVFLYFYENEKHIKCVKSLSKLFEYCKVQFYNCTWYTMVYNVWYIAVAIDSILLFYNIDSNRHIDNLNSMFYCIRFILLYSF